MKLVELAGKRFGRFTVVRYVGNSHWWCHCDCGKEMAVDGGRLRYGNTKSCGCLRVDMGRARGTTLNLRHGEGRNKKESPEYRAWGQMLSRCENTKHTSFRWYGAKGVSVCERWHVYENFLADVGRRPTPYHSLDRVCVTGNYESGNVRWATATQQNRNTTSNRYITIKNEIKTLAEWLELVSLRRETFYQRLRRGMTEEEAITTPRMPPGKKPQQ